MEPIKGIKPFSNLYQRFVLSLAPYRHGVSEETQTLTNSASGADALFNYATETIKIQL
jgi:hypothetical protein